ncbi:MAG: hypothetical protein IT203_04750 [Fimbriimonadaceae bacterium]|nr:hypothetical protein [Fimbriimonadaceae bacterium]
MSRKFGVAIFVLACGLATGQQGGEQGIYQRSAIDAIERGLASYLNSEYIKSVLTPGETVEWKISMKPGQVVVGDAMSEAFDPGLEIVDSQGKTLAKNDDRYPGDQRPLVFWRCEQAGDYKLCVRSFQNKAGGQVYVRFKTYETLDVIDDKKADGTFDATKPFLVRVPMKAGQIKDMTADLRGEGNFLTFNFGVVITPSGLPERSPSLAEPISPAIRALIAPVDGDYYMVVTPYGYVGGAGRVRIGTRSILPTKLAKSGSVLSATAPTNVPALYELDVKQGDLLEISTPELAPTSQFRLAEAIDFSKFDVSKPETNPFFPVPRTQPPGPGTAFDLLPGRARDGRITVFRARRDAKLWLASNGAGPANKTFTLSVKPAAREFGEEKLSSGVLRTGNTDYWAFDAKAGDVMTLDFNCADFTQVVVVRDPDLAEIRQYEAALDQTTESWRLIVQKPGRYLVCVSCWGNGGGGTYSLNRKVYRPQEFGKGKPAKGTIAPGEIQIWKFTAMPNDPLLVKWISDRWGYDIAVYNEAGQPDGFQQQEIDASTRLGILKVGQPHTYLIVLTGGPAKANFTIELTSIKT